MRPLAALLLAAGLGAAEPAPAQAPPAAPAPAAAYVLAWDDYRSVAVVGEGVGLQRPAWIATWAARPLRDGQAADPLPSLGRDLPRRWPPSVVAYRALAYLDARGGLHLDGRGALIVGRMAAMWSPDSFLIHPDGTCGTIDDDPDHAANAGTVEEVVPADGERYRVLRQVVELAVGGGI